MTKASSIFDVYEFANYLTKDESGDVWIWSKRPRDFCGRWVLDEPCQFMQIGNEIEEFKDKDWTECCIERPKGVKTFEQLRAWAKERAEVDDIVAGRFHLDYGTKIFFIIEKHGEETCIYTDYGDYIFGAEPAKVKRVLEAMLND